MHFFQKKLACFLLSALTLSILMAAGLALAAGPTLGFTNVPESTYTVYDGSIFEAEVELTGYMEDTDVELIVRGPLGEPSEADQPVTSYEYITNGTHVFGWDGKFAGNYPLPGTYQLRFQGEDLYSNMTNLLTHSFTLTEEANIELNPAPAGTFNTTVTPLYEIDYDFESALMGCMVFKVDDQFISVNGPVGDGNYTATWDGKISSVLVSEGVHSWELFSDPGYCVGTEADTNTLASGDVTVSHTEPSASPSISDLSVSETPYDPEAGSVTFGYKLNDSSGSATINAEVYPSGSPGTPVKEWTLTNQPSGSNTLSWNGKDSSADIVDNGSYVFKVSGTDGAAIPSQQTTFTVTAGGGPSGGECAGYSDVDDTDPACDAIEYVKSIGAMTGNPDGTFEPDEILQRDQVAKISLETFDLYNDASDYCGGDPAFPDVPSSQWSYQYICRGVALDMITGYLSGPDAGYYRPARSVNRVEFLALILRNSGETIPALSSSSYDDVATNQWYSGYAKYSYDHSLFAGSNLHPTQVVTREEVADVLLKLHEQGVI